MPFASRVIVVVGYSADWQRSLTRLRPDELVVFIDEPDVIRKRAVRDQLAGFEHPWRLIEWEYQRPGAADGFVAEFGDLQALAVLPGLEYAVPFAARLAERCGRPGAGYGAARILRDKSALRRVTAAAGIANPPSQEVGSLSEVRDFLAVHGLPAIIKPANRQAALGTHVLTGSSDVDTAWRLAQVQDEGPYVPDRSLPLRMLVEAFVEGTEFSVDMLVRDGVPVFGNVTGKRLFPGPHPVELGHTVPADVPGDVRGGLLLGTRRVLDAVGFGSGFVHCEWIVSDGVPHLVECAGRMPGDMIVPMIDHAYDTDVVSALLSVMSERPVTVPLPARPERCTAIQFLSVPPGRVEEVGGVEEARALPGVLGADIHVKPGAEVGELRSSHNRVAAATAAAPTTAQAVENVAAAMERLVVKTLPETEPVETARAEEATQARIRPAAGTTALPGPSVLFLGGAGPVALSEAVVEPALLEGRAAGVRTHVTNKPADLAGNTEALRALADAVSPVDFDDPDACAAWARERVAAGERFDVVLGVREKAQRAVAEVAAALGVPGNAPEAVRRVQTKDACRARLAEAGFPQPEFRVCSGEEDALAFLRESQGPWIVKPRDAMGSLGVSLVREPGELTAAVEALVDPAGTFLVEEFVEGTEYSVEGVFLGGRPKVLAVTGKETMEPPLFVEVAHVLPAALPGETRDEIERQVCAALTELELVYGIFHVELWVTPRGIVLGEVHVRPGGDGIYLMLAHAIPGLELFRMVYDDALGRPAATGGLMPARAAAVRFLMPPPGRLLSVAGWDRVRSHPDVLFAELTVEPGSVIRPVRESEDRVGLVVVGAEDSAAAQRLASELVGSVEFTVEPAGHGAEHA